MKIRLLKQKIDKMDILAGGIIGALVSLWVSRAFIALQWGGVRYWLAALGVWLIGGLGLIVLFAFLVRPALSLLTRRQRVLVVFICLGLGGLNLTYWQPPLPNLVTFPAHISVTALNEKNPLSAGDEVALLGFKLGDQFGSYQTFTTTGLWPRVEQSLSAPAARPAEFAWSGPAYRLSLIFKTSPQGGKVMVFSGEHSQIYDLYSTGNKPLEVDYYNQPILTPACDLLVYWILSGVLALLIICPVILTWQTQPPEQNEDRSATPVGLLNTYGWMAGVMAAAGFYLVFVTWNFGAWIATDSTNYLSAARHLIGGAGYIDFDLAPYVWWPPLYPALLSVLSLPVLTNPLEWARWLNILLFAATIGGGFYLTAQIASLRSPWMLMAAALILICSRPTVTTFSFLLSEPLFIFSMVFYFVCLYRFLKFGRTMDALGFTLFAAVHVLSRYIGAVLVGVGLMTTLFLIPGSWYQRLTRALSFGAASSFMVILWLWHNILVSRSLTGPRPSPRYGIFECLLQAKEMLVNWFGFGEGYLALVVILCGGLAVWFIWKGWRNENEPLRVKWAVSLVMFMVFYSIVMIASFSVLDNQPVLDRYLSPIFIPGLILLFYMVERLRETIRNTFFHRALPLVWLIFIIPALPTAIELFNTRATATSTSFSMYSLQDSSLVKTLHTTVLPDLPLYSNCQRCLYIYAGIHPATIFDEDPMDKPYMPASPQDLPAVLVWFNQVTPGKMSLPEPRPLPDIHKLLGMDVQVSPIVETDDGGVYQIFAGKP